MITQLRSKEAGFSLLELSVAVGVAAIVAAGAITATTTFIGGAAEKRDNYVSNAETSISNAESSSLALGAAGVVEAGPTMVSSTDGLTSVEDWDFGLTFNFNGSDAVPADVKEALDNGTTVTVTTLGGDEVVLGSYTVTYYENPSWSQGNSSVSLDISNGGEIVSSTANIGNDELAWWQYNGQSWVNSFAVN